MNTCYPVLNPNKYNLSRSRKVLRQRTLPDLVEKISKLKTRADTQYSIKSGKSIVGGHSICIKYISLFWAINFEVNWRSSNSKDSWGHWQYVWLIMTHKSTLTLVIAGFWLVGNFAWELKRKWFPLSSYFFFFWQTFLLSPFSPSPYKQCCYFSFLHPEWCFFFPKKYALGEFQRFINLCLHRLICYPFEFMMFFLFYVCWLRPDLWRPPGIGGIPSCSVHNSYSMCGNKSQQASTAINTCSQIQWSIKGWVEGRLKDY